MLRGLFLAARPDCCADERQYYESKSFKKEKKLSLGAGHLLLILMKLALSTSELEGPLEIV